MAQTFVCLFQAFDSLEANVSSEKWVLYFNSQNECERFIKALSDCWSTYFQVSGFAVIIPYHYVKVSILLKFSQKTSVFTLIIRSSP